MGWRAVLKKAYKVFRERGYRIRLLSAAFRNHMHWSEFIGGDMVISPPYAWQVRFNASDIEVRSRIDEPVSRRSWTNCRGNSRIFAARAPKMVSRIENSIHSAPTRRTLRQFITACHDLDALVRDILIPNPEV